MSSTEAPGATVPLMSKHALFMGTFVHSKALDELEYLHDTCVAVSAPEGIIAAIEKGIEGSADDVKSTMVKKLGWNDAVEVTDHRSSGKEGWFFPGFVDTHIHAPQYPNSGLFGKTTLLDWLNTYTFPAEESIGRDQVLANRVYSRVVQQTLSHGTTTASYYATISVEATNLLSLICLSQGQRAFIGRVCMDTELSPSTYRDLSAEDSIEASVLSAEFCGKIDPARKALVPILTPRFAPSCTPKLLSMLGDLARERDLPIQTHISENPSEVALVASVFPGSRDYADVYDAANLLTPKTVLAHCVHLTPRERRTVLARGCGVSHCPASNSSITSGECPVRSLLDDGISKIGLGTDVSGGFSPSVLVSARQALLVSRHVAMKTGNDADKLSVEEVLYLATRGGAEVMALGSSAGSFEVGKSWDAQFVRVGSVNASGTGSSDAGEHATGPVDLFGTETWEEVLQKWLFTGDDRNTRSVWARGRLVHRKK
ncbi:Metallo-dependent hydrolase [Zalerion maritima]|uniref:Probable guanine deaminase n=1 Tax=Zalerion maritima TaxID=339359 RepID=A0AAD5WVG0_9PEZI|nr:Metallo-dependent hydrolase [Zalerion maritima]